jgi:IS30 family transposase
MGFKQLDYRKRCQILAFWKAGYRQRYIAKEIGVHESTISRELKRNITFVRTKLGSWQYDKGLLKIDVLSMIDP